MSASPHAVRQSETKGKQDWRTPPDLFAALHKEFEFTIDGAASKENTLCPRYITEWMNALTFHIEGETVFCNPPYGKENGGLLAWVHQFANWADHACAVVALIPNSMETAWMRFCMATASEIRLTTKRVSFLGDDGRPVNGNTHGSTIVIWRPRHYLSVRAQAHWPGAHIWYWDWEAA